MMVEHKLLVLRQGSWHKLVEHIQFWLLELGGMQLELDGMQLGQILKFWLLEHEHRQLEQLQLCVQDLLYVH